MKGQLVQHYKVTDEWGNTLEITLWTVPATIDKPHGFKYSLVYIVDNQRVIGYDNHERKGDHRHYSKETFPYKFESIEKLKEDFFNDVLNYKENNL